MKNLLSLSNQALSFQAASTLDCVYYSAPHPADSRPALMQTKHFARVYTPHQRVTVASSFPTRRQKCSAFVRKVLVTRALFLNTLISRAFQCEIRMAFCVRIFATELARLVVQFNLEPTAQKCFGLFFSFACCVFVLGVCKHLFRHNGKLL